MTEYSPARINRDYYCLIAATAIITAVLVIAGQPSGDDCSDHNGLKYIKTVDDFGRVAVVCNDSYVVKLTAGHKEKP